MNPNVMCVVAQRATSRFVPGSETVYPPPGPPENLRLAAEPQHNSVMLEWDVPTAGGPVGEYELLRDDAAIQSELVEPAATDSTVEPDTTYSYTVRAVGPGGTGPLSAALVVQVPEEEAGSELGTVLDLVATPGDGRVTLTWTPAANCDGQIPEYRIGTSGTWSFWGTTLSPSASELEVTGLTNGTVYQFRIVAGLVDGVTVTYGNEVTVTPEPPVGLGTPSNLSATPGDGQVSLSWTPAANATSHQPQRRTGTTGSWQNAGSQMGGSASSRIVTGLTNGQLYQFRVQASDGVETTTSGVVSATPNVPSTEHPNEPIGFSPITERSFSSRAENGWPAGRDGQGASPMTFHIVDDPTAPRSPGSVGECRSPAGWTGAGSSSRCVDLGYSGWSSGHIYLRFWVKYSDPYYNHDTAGVSKIFYITDETTGGSGDPIFVAIAGGGHSRMRFQVRSQAAGSINGSPGNFNFRHEIRTGDYWVNELPGVTLEQAEIVRGRWHDIEMILRMNSAGQQNGEVHAWVDGTKIIQYTSCVITGNSSKRTFDTIRLHPVYGGASGAGATPTQQSIFIDHLYLSGA